MTDSKTHYPPQPQCSTYPLPADELAEMFAMLEVLLLRRGCDNKLTISERWLRGGGHDVARVVRWLNEHGGYCDCEVLFNVVPKTGLPPV
jgi:Protein of unknown function (DUF2695)